MCGATDCRSCGPAQGYEVVPVWRKGRRRWINPEDIEPTDRAEDADSFDEPDPYDIPTVGGAGWSERELP
jgi:hypothetical protein